MGDDIRRSRAMAGIGVLRVTALLAMMATAVKGSIAGIHTFEPAKPVFGEVLSIFRCGLLVACLFVSTVAAENVLFDLAAVTARIDANFASATKTLMARSGTVVFPTRHDIVADLPTAPAILIIGIDTSSCGLVLATETHLCRTHVGTPRAGTGVAGELARVRTLPDSFFAASVSTRVRRQASQRPGLDFLLTPAGIVLWKDIFG